MAQLAGNGGRSPPGAFEPRDSALQYGAVFVN